MAAFDPVKTYSTVRGFNFQPDWSANGVGVWLKFDARRYRQLIVRAKELFPGMNTLRVWLSFDAWCEYPAMYLDHVHQAAVIIEQEGLKMIPVYFNGWFGIPVFGGFVPEILAWSRKTDRYKNFRLYLQESLQAVSSDAILLHDLSNEPFNNVWGHRQRTETVMDFLQDMSLELHRLDEKPVTIGSQGSFPDNGMGLPDIKSPWGDIDLLAPLVDVITLHPYCIPPTTAEEHLNRLTQVVEYIRGLEKPVIITECCWAGRTDEERLPFLDIELPHYARLGIGFCVHALADSPVADLHPLDDGRGLSCLGIYMAFMTREGQIRKGHERFNLY
jgi:hypothetical protein